MFKPQYDLPLNKVIGEVCARVNMLNYTLKMRKTNINKIFKPEPGLIFFFRKIDSVTQIIGLVGKIQSDLQFCLSTNNDMYIFPKISLITEQRDVFYLLLSEFLWVFFLFYSRSYFLVLLFCIHIYGTMLKMKANL